MPRNEHLRDRGFTLIEMAITLLIVAVATFSVFRVFTATNQTYKRGTESIDGQQNTRAALTWLSRELRSAKGFTLIDDDELTFVSDKNVPGQIRTFKLDEDDDDGDGDTSELLLIRNPDDNGDPGVFQDEIALGIDSLVFVYRDAAGNQTQSRTSVAEVEVFIFAKGNSMREEEREEVHGMREVAMSTRVRCRNLGKSVPSLGDVTPPAAPTGIFANMGCGTATVGWNANSETDIAGYYLFYSKGSGGSPYTGTDADQGPSPIFVGNVTAYTLTGLDLAANYYVNLQAVDTADNTSGYGTEANGMPQDSSPPGTPQNLTGRVVSNDQIQLSWSPLLDWDLAWYRISWRNDVDPLVVNVDSTQQSSMVIGGLVANAVHYFSISASDHCGNVSPQSSEITVTMVPCDDDVTFPAIPTNFGATPGDEFVQLTWDAVPDTDVVGYQVYFSKAGGTGTTLLVGNVLSYSVYGLDNGTEYKLQVAALDGCGNLGGYTGLVSATPYQCGGTQSAPTAPANLTATDVGLGDRVALSWALGYERDVLGYRVYWGSSAAALSNQKDVGDTIFYTMGGLITGAKYFFAVSAYDVCGNESPLTSPVAVTPTWGCACPPAASITTPSDYAILSGTVAWQVSAAPCSSASLDHVEFRINGATRHVDYTSPYEFGDFGMGWDTVYETDGAYVLVSVATDDNGCETADSVAVYVDNSGLGVGCVAVPESAQAVIKGTYGEILEVEVENESAIDTYETKGVIVEWDDPGITLMSLAFDQSVVWDAPGFPGAYSGDSLWLSPSYLVYPEDGFDLEITFGDISGGSPPDIDLASTAVNVTFLGTPVSPCGPYPLTIRAPACLPTLSIYSVNSSNPYDVWGVPAIGDKYYTDRSYVLTYLPVEIQNSILVRTPNNDKNKGDSHRLKLDFEQDVTLYIAYDPRGNPPDWIEDNYTDTGLSIGVTDSGTSTLGLWKRNRSAGIRTFRGNKAAGWGGTVGTNYLIFVVCKEGAS